MKNRSKKLLVLGLALSLFAATGCHTVDIVTADKRPGAYAAYETELYPSWFLGLFDGGPNENVFPEKSCKDRGVALARMETSFISGFVSWYIQGLIPWVASMTSTAVYCARPN